MAKDVHPNQDYLDALEREKQGYQRRAAASDDKELKERMTDRTKQVDKQIARLKKAEGYTPESAEEEPAEAVG